MTDPKAPIRHVARASIVAVRGATVERRLDTLTGEEPMEIRAAGRARSRQPSP